MYPRQLYKYHKTCLLLLFYLTVYFLISYALDTETAIAFVSDDYRIGDKYVYMFLVAPEAPVLSDSEGADVFARCGRCVLSNNKGFMPLTEYDAIIVSDWSILTQIPYVDPCKRYFINTRYRCLKTKLRGCIIEPTITSSATKESYDLCSLCETLTKKKKYL